MGIEFRIRLKGDWPPTVVSPETFLERLPARACFSKQAIAAAFGGGILEIRHAGAEGMPAACVHVEEGGFYVLDNGDATIADLVLGELVRYLLGYGSITIDEP